MKANRPESRDITSITLQVILIILMITAGFWTIHPFLTPLIWAIIIVVATWPLMLKVQSFMRGRRFPAVVVMSTGLLMLFVIPLSLAIMAIVDKSDEIVGWSRSLATTALAPPPSWLNNIPFLGPKLTESWKGLTAANLPELSDKIVPYSKKIISWFVGQAGNIGMMVLNFIFTVIISAVLYAKGETAANGVIRLARRLAGSQGENAMYLAAHAVRGVALGVVLTALAQTVLGGLGLAVAGVPACLLLTGIMFLFCIAQLGPALILIPSIIWLYWSGQTLSGTVLVVFSVVACTLDNFIRPYLIRKGADLPLVLIFGGVIGGLVAFGIIGLFIGPVILAVIYTLLRAWVIEGDSETKEESVAVSE